MDARNQRIEEERWVVDYQVRLEKLVAQGAEDDRARHIIEFDPRASDHCLFAAAPGTAAVVEMAAAALRPDPIPWPQGVAPTLTRPGDPSTPTRSPPPTCWW